MLATRHIIFLEVASRLSFSEASKVLFISQPAISKHIKSLEAYYKTALFERKGNSIVLTDAGEILFQKVKEARKIQNNAELEISTLQQKVNAKGQLRLGASTTVALYILPKILSSFHKRYANVKISLLNRNTDTIIEALLNEDIDIGIVEGKRKSTSLVYKPFITDEVVAVCSKDSFIAKKRAIQIRDILNYPVVLREQGSGTLSALKDSLGKKGIKLSNLKVNVILSGTEALKNFIKADDSLGFLPMGSIVKEVESGELVIVKIEDFKIVRNFYFIQRHGTENNELNKLFIKVCTGSL
ncbi:MAG: LysR family transcriptional regulator [Sphingobacteriia bacterium]|nr:LysR family transcriptional regulator [Sphingobacteriia bacterium]